MIRIPTWYPHGGSYSPRGQLARLVLFAGTAVFGVAYVLTALSRFAVAG